MKLSQRRLTNLDYNRVIALDCSGVRRQNYIFSYISISLGPYHKSHRHKPGILFDADFDFPSIFIL